MKYQGILVAESLQDASVLSDVTIVNTEVEPVTEGHRTPWITQWTMHTFEVPEDSADDVARKISASLDPEHAWYADFKNDRYHYIVFLNKLFKIDRTKPEEYAAVTAYGLTVGIPAYQLDFTPSNK